MSYADGSVTQVPDLMPLDTLRRFSEVNRIFIAEHKHEKSALKPPELHHQIADTLLISGLYWGVHTQKILDVYALDPPWCVKTVLDCQCTESGAFAGSFGHDVHILYT